MPVFGFTMQAHANAHPYTFFYDLVLILNQTDMKIKSPLLKNGSVAAWEMVRLAFTATGALGERLARDS